MPPQMPKLKTPLEVVDLGADIANHAFRTPAKIFGNALSAAGQTFKNLEADIRRPADYAEIPPPPDVLVEPAISGVGHIVEGAINTVKGAVDGVLESADGVRREIQSFVGR